MTKKFPQKGSPVNSAPSMAPSIIAVFIALSLAFSAMELAGQSRPAIAFDRMNRFGRCAEHHHRSPSEIRNPPRLGLRGWI
jgi:hypothetical protein